MSTELDEIVLRLGARLTCAAELLTDDADPDAAAALETIIEHSYPALLDGVERLQAERGPTSIYKMVEVPADDLERLIRLAEGGAGAFMEGPARNAAIMTVRSAESLWVTATGRAR